MLGRSALGSEGIGMDDLIHIHEDDWGLRCLYPLAARDEAVTDLEDGIAFAEKHCDPSGYGWTDVHEIRTPSVTYTEKGRAFEAAARVLQPIMPRVRRFYATASGGFASESRDPWGSYDEEAWCFGLGAHCYIKLDGKDGLVENIWFDLQSRDPDAVS